jgi:chorismate mutase/prephenate dehydratase
MSNDDDRLRPLRDKIDNLDRQIIALLSERASVALDVGKIKHETGAPVFRPEREQQVLKKLAGINPGPIKAEGIKAIWTEIMSACRSVEAIQTVAYLGPIGTFSEEAASKFFGSGTHQKSCQTLDEIFRQVESDHSEFGVVPIENSSEGVISRTLDLLLESNVTIIGEVSLPIRHNLLSLHGRIEDAVQVLAHPQALAQCQQWLNSHVPQLQRQAVASNGEAAKLAALNPQYLAIASMNAAQSYGLQILCEGIQDDLHNRTRFVVIGKQACGPSGRDQTSLILSVANQPGAVYRLLAPLDEFNVSMNRFESRPARTGTWEYYFYIDIDGHQTDVNVAKALDKLKTIAAYYKCLGSYPKSSL